MKLKSKLNKNDLATLCKRCAGAAKTCCCHTDIYLTMGDVHRISDEIKSGHFFEYRAPADPSYMDQEDDPVWASSVFRSDGSRRVIKQDDRGYCIFLNYRGCRLSLDVRPLICRLHPHMYNYKEIYPFISSDCPVALLEPQEKLENMIEGFDQLRAKLWHRMLYEEIGREVSDSC